MSFATPAALWALPLAGLPVLVHLLSRLAARRQVFSDRSLLAAVLARSRPRSRLRELLLLATRCLLLACLVLAAAGPTVRGSTAAAAAEGLDLVVLLDASYSMRAREGGLTRFILARETGRRLLKRLAAADRVAVGVFDTALSADLSWGDAQEADRLLSRAACGLRGTDASAALAAARALLEKSPRGRRRAVAVLGDGAAHMFPSPAPAPAEGASVIGLSLPSLPNAWLEKVSPALGSSAREPKLAVRLAASGAASQLALDLWVADRRAGSTASGVAAGAQATAVLALPAAADAREPSWTGRVVARPDALSEDDRAYFSVRQRAAPRVLVLRSRPDFDRAGQPGWFLRGLFGGAERSLTGRQADFLESSRWTEADFSRYGTVLLADAERLPPGLSSALFSFASRGGGVWVVPGPKALPADLAELSSWMPARIGPVEASASPGVRVLVAGAETAGWDEFELSRVAFERSFRLEPSAGAKVWISDAAGSPLLVSGPVGRGRAVVWGVPLEAASGNLALKPLFVPWAQACLSLTLPADDGQRERSAHVGEPLVRVWSPSEPAPDRVSVRAPDGRRVRLSVRARRAELPSADLPGLYEFDELGGGRTVFAVNLDSSRGESDLTAAAHPPWTSAAPEELEDIFRARVYGQDRRGVFLFLAALALAVEMVLSLPWAAAALSLVLFALPAPVRAQQGDRFVWSQLQLGRTWDPYPDAAALAAQWLAEVTSARVAAGRRVLKLEDPDLFSSPFLYLAGREAPAPLSDAQLRRLRQYLAGGGLLWIEDSSGGPPGSFDRWVRATVREVLPEGELKPLPLDHVLYRTFFLLRAPAGRVSVHGSVEAVGWGGRERVLYTRDDILGTWAKDALGHPLRACVPGGELQREMAHRLTLNILMYGLTGSYKADAVHQSAILDKLRLPP